MPAALGRAAGLLREAELVTVLFAPDADSVLGAALVGLALQRTGIAWHARCCAALDDAALAPLAEEAPGQPFVLAGLGGREPAALEAPGLGEPVVLDARHPRLPAKRGVAFEDPLPGGTSATLAFDLARALEPRTPALPALASLDAVGPVEGADGVRARLAGEALAQGAQLGPAPALGRAPLVEALAASVEPFLPGLSGRARAAKRFLEGLGLPPGALAEDLDAAARERLASALVLHVLARGAPAHGARPLLAPDVRGPGPASARGLARLCGGAVEAGRPGLALASAMGDPRDEAEALGLAEERHQRLLEALVKLEGGGEAVGVLRAEGNLAAEVAWGVAVSFRGGEPAAVLGAQGHLHVAAPLLDPRFLGQAAWQAAKAVGGQGSGLGHRALLRVPEGQGPEAWEQLRRQLGVVA